MWTKKYEVTDRKEGPRDLARELGNPKHLYFERGKLNVGSDRKIFTSPSFSMKKKFEIFLNSDEIFGFRRARLTFPKKKESLGMQHITFEPIQYLRVCQNTPISK